MEQAIQYEVPNIFNLDAFQVVSKTDNVTLAAESITVAGVGRVHLRQEFEEAATTTFNTKSLLVTNGITVSDTDMDLYGISAMLHLEVSFWTEDKDAAQQTIYVKKDFLRYTLPLHANVANLLTQVRRELTTFEDRKIASMDVIITNVGEHFLNLSNLSIRRAVTLTTLIRKEVQDYVNNARTQELEALQFRADGFKATYDKSMADFKYEFKPGTSNITALIRDDGHRIAVSVQ